MTHPIYPPSVATVVGVSTNEKRETMVILSNGAVFKTVAGGPFREVAAIPNTPRAKERAEVYNAWLEGLPATDREEHLRRISHRATIAGGGY